MKVLLILLAFGLLFIIIRQAVKIKNDLSDSEFDDY